MKPSLGTVEGVPECDVLAVFMGTPGIDEAHKERGLSPVEGRRFEVGHVARLQTIGEPQVEVDRFGRSELGREPGWGWHPSSVRATADAAPHSSICSKSFRSFRVVWSVSSRLSNTRLTLEVGFSTCECL